jgi:hypothetical protein
MLKELITNPHVTALILLRGEPGCIDQLVVPTDTLSTEFIRDMELLLCFLVL